MPLSSVVGAQSIVRPGVCTSSTRPASPYDGQVIYETDTDTMLVYEGSAWKFVRPQIAIFNETQASGTNGGTATSGSYAKRTLNTTVVNGITGCSISSSVITLASGTYRLTAVAPVFSVTTYSSRLQNTTDSTTTQQGSVNYCSTDNNGFSRIEAYFTITTTKSFEIQTRVGATKTTNGFGAGAGFGDEIFTQVMIERWA